MMEALGDWLKQIILVVLLATFIDLLLPNRTMQRYVKLVVSLFLLMTILSPVMVLLGSNPSLRMLAATVDGWTVSGTALSPGGGIGGAPGGRSIPALGEVLAEGKSIERKRNEEALSLLAVTLESMIVDHVRTQHQTDAAAEATLTLDADGMPVLYGIRLRLGAALAEQGDAPLQEAGAHGSMEPVKPVEIEPVHMEPVRIGEDAAGDDARTDRAPKDVPVWQGRSLPDLPPAADRKAIAASVAKAWGIPVSRVHVE